MKKVNIIAYILLTPALVSVPLFLINLVITGIDTLGNLGANWTGGAWYSSDNAGAGFTSSAPFYFGLMAIAGASLLKRTPPNQ